MNIQRLTSSDRNQARELFTLMADVFEVEHDELSNEYLDRLLAREDFWAMAAVADGVVLGGLTAHTLPMTRTAMSELFIFDLAVHPDQQRTGVGRALVAALRAEAAQQGIGVVFVPADNEDTHALDFYDAIGGTATPVTIFTFLQERDDATSAPTL